MSHAGQFVYEDEALRSVAFPLGAIGTGHFCICGDGGFRQWQIFNQVNHMAYLPGTFLAIRTHAGREEPKSVLLQCSSLHNDKDFEPAPSISDHILPPDAKILPRELPTVGSIRMEAMYPIAKLKYGDHGLPVEVALSAFSPFIPLDEKNSGLPAVFLILSVGNPTKSPVQVSLMASLQNAVGWDGKTQISGTSYPLYGGNRNVLLKKGRHTVLMMENTLLENDSPRKGEMALAVLSKGASGRPEWNDLGSLWADFVADGRLTSGSFGPSPLGRTYNGALSVAFRLEPGAVREVVFLVAWYFPNRYVNWDQRGLGVKDERSKLWLGNAYSTWFSGVLDVVEYASKKYQDLRRWTELFRDCLAQTSLPKPVLDAVSSQMSTICSPTCFRQEDGRFFGFEGCRGSSTGCSCDTGGCCPLNCTHVWNYEQTLSRLFPGLERTMRYVDLEFQMGEDGRIPHRTVLPLYLPRWYDDDRTSAVYAADGHCGTILKTYREFRASGDREFFDRNWPALKKALKFAIDVWDPDQDGVFDGPQWNTYDCHLHGHNSFVSGLYLAALRAMEEMAKLQWEEDLAAKCRGIFERGSSIIDSELWNGEYYVQKYDANKQKSMQYGSGCHSDQLLGQWWAHILDLDYILPREHVRRALRSIYEYNFRRYLKGHEQKPRTYLRDEEGGLLICTWPKGGRPDPVTLYCDEVWTGIEYTVAGLMFFEGMTKEGSEIVAMARSRHDGKSRNPWNEVECGDHYVRPMSSWTMLEALSGYRYDAANGSMSFGPPKGKIFQCLFVASHSWGTYSHTSDTSCQVHEIRVEYGSLDLKAVRLPKFGISPRSFEVFLGERKVEEASIQGEGELLLVKGTFNIPEGEVLKIVSK